MWSVRTWVWEHLLEHRQPLRAHIPEEHWLSPQLAIKVNTFSDGVGLREPLRNPCWNFRWFDLVQILCMQFQLLQVCVCDYAIPSRKYCLYYRHPTPADPFIFLPLLPWWHLSLGGKGCGTDVSFWGEHATVSYSPPIDWWLASTWIINHCKKRASLMGCRDTLICGYKDMNLRVVYYVSLAE